MVIIIKFDLETVQFNVINTFIYTLIDRDIFIKTPPGYHTPGKVLKLLKVLYSLRRSPFLWQRNLTNIFEELGFKVIP